MKIMKGRAAKTARVAPVFQTVLIGVFTYVLLVSLLLLAVTPEQHDIQIGSPATVDIMATKDVNDIVTTEQKREEAAAQVEPSYRSVDSSVAGEVAEDLESRFTALMGLRSDHTVEQVTDMTDDEITDLSEQLGFSISRDQLVALLQSDEEQLNALFSDCSRLVRNLLNSTLLEGQEASAISTVSRSLVAAGYPMPLTALSFEILRVCMRPNMLIDEEATEANRQKARDLVETVTCVKGEVIVRRGEIVSNAQYQMLSSLGLLKEDDLDVPLFAGIALTLLLIMGSLALYLYRFRRDLLKPKPLSLLCLVYVLVVALSLSISYRNTYLMPVALGTMLISLLVDHRIALYFNFALGLTVSLLADTSGGLFTVAMFSVVMMSMVSAPVILSVFAHSMQRTTTLVAGVLAGISNFLVTLAVGLINSAELSAVTTNAVWAFFGGLLSAVLCIGVQPLMEWIFNLATNAKLIELSNPNQPLLRRLLLEAPGTYHHAIIVANLAEAAATSIGGNGLLARVGAYFHDIGKLKRPIYFSENQMGDNPHDRTDPRVSAAILTAHPRDGAAMAQKAHIPEPIVDIIRQHHGDGVALWFYDKAVKQYGADQVDIAAFRYGGPRPRTKEAAVVMLADTIEAAVRSIPDPDPEKVDALIRKLVRGKLDDGQLDESELTFSDLDRICSAFSTVLTGVFHERIEYPDVAIPPRTDKPDDAGEQTQKPASKPHPAVQKPVVPKSPSDSGAADNSPEVGPGALSEAAAVAGAPSPSEPRIAPAAPEAPTPAHAASTVPPSDKPVQRVESSADAAQAGASAEASTPEAQPKEAGSLAD
ncbi:MAG: HDIG domain-containing protein [Clostridia bacterium]|nr:HDIG domain-containing protein [Clostridia bacterium]